MSILLYAVFGTVVLLALMTLVLPASITSSLRSVGTLPLWLLIAISTAMLGNAWLEYSQHLTLIKQSTGGGDWHAHLARKLEAERDAILCVTVIVLLILIARFVPLSVDHHKLQLSHHAMEKQAKSASQAFMSNLSTSGKDPVPATSTSSSTESDKTALTKEVTSLRDQLAKANKNLTALEMQARAASSAALDSITSTGSKNPLVTANELQKQVQELKSELVKSQQENAQLKTQLSDFDIVLGDARKKAL